MSSKQEFYKNEYSYKNMNVYYSSLVSSAPFYSNLIQLPNWKLNLSDKNNKTILFFNENKSKVVSVYELIFQSNIVSVRKLWGYNLEKDFIPHDHEELKTIDEYIITSFKFLDKSHEFINLIGFKIVTYSKDFFLKNWNVFKNNSHLDVFGNELNGNYDIYYKNYSIDHNFEEKYDNVETGFLKVEMKGETTPPLSPVTSESQGFTPVTSGFVPFTTSTQQSSPSLFGTGSTTTSTQQSSPSLFGTGSTTTSTQQSSPSIFGTGSTTTSTQQSSPSIFGTGSTTTSTQQSSPYIFGNQTYTGFGTESSLNFGSTNNPFDKEFKKSEQIAKFDFPTTSSTFGTGSFTNPGFGSFTNPNPYNIITWKK